MADEDCEYQPEESPDWTDLSVAVEDGQVQMHVEMRDESGSDLIIALDAERARRLGEMLFKAGCNLDAVTQ